MKKGFTLVELLAVLVILGLIGLLVFPAIERAIKGVRKDLYETQKTAIIDGLKNWIADNPKSLPEENGQIIYVSLGQLKIGSYVDINITNPKTDKLFDTATKVLIKRENNKYKYEVVLNDNTLVEETKTSNLSYPKVEFNGDLVMYLEVGNTYTEPGLKINNINCMPGNCQYDIEFDSSNVDTTTAGSYYVKYILGTTTKLVIYRTVIVE